PGGDNHTFPDGKVHHTLAEYKTQPDKTWENGNGTPSNAGYGANYQGFTVGPRYWGKTFFIWPPDPRTPDATARGGDWRKRFFFKADGTTPCNDNTLLWDAGGNWKNPSGNYVINYKAILRWIKDTTGTNNVNPFPSQMRNGRVILYDSIPDDVP